VNNPGSARAERLWPHVPFYAISSPRSTVTAWPPSFTRCDVLHPRVVAFSLEQADRGGVAAECLIGERVDLIQPHQNVLGAVPPDFRYSHHTIAKPAAITPAMQTSRNCPPYIFG